MESGHVDATIVDKVDSGEIQLEEMNRVGVDKDSSSEIAKRLIDFLLDYDFEIVHSEGLIIIKIILDKFNVLIIPMGEKRILTGSDSRRILENLSDYINEEKKNVVIYYTPGGRLLTSAYLFLGHLIEKHKIGILFVNGGPEEILEVLESLREKGEFVPREDDYVKIM